MECMNITALISIGTVVVPAVPTDAIVSHQGQDYIFVETKAPAKHADEHKENEHNEAEHADEKEHEEKPSWYYQRVQVIKGTSDVGYTEVKLVENIPPNTPIITKGAFFVLAKMTNTGGHNH